MVNEPLSPCVAIAVTTPAETVAIAVLLETHVAVAVICCPPLQVAVKGKLGWFGVRVPLVGLMTGALVQATETVRGWVPLIDGSRFEVAVMVPLPVSCPAVTSPELEIVAMAPPPDPVPVTLQLTGVLLDEPSLKVPTANICTVLLVVPV